MCNNLTAWKVNHFCYGDMFQVNIKMKIGLNDTTDTVHVPSVAAAATPTEVAKQQVDALMTRLLRTPEI